MLPVSNLTNLLAVARLDRSDAAGFVALLGGSAAVAILVSTLILALVFRRALRGSFVPAPSPAIADRPQLRFAATVVVVMMPLLVSGLEPWMPATAAALVLVLREALVAVMGEGTGPGDLWRLAGAGALAANVGSNLPAYLALESAAGTPERLAALLIGVNAGPLITPWASLATLLWHQRLKAVGIEVPWTRYALLGALAAPLTVFAAVVPLAL